MVVQRIRDYLFDSKRDIQERLLMLLTVTAMSGMVVSFVFSLLGGENPEGILSMFFAFLVFVAVFYFGFKKNAENKANRLCRNA